MRWSQVVGLDGSDGSKRTIPFALGLARRDQGKMVIAHVEEEIVGKGGGPIRAFAAENRIELVPTPTYASYLNPIECHFTPIAQFVFGNADYLDWAAANFALAKHLSHRNGPHRGRRLERARASASDRRLRRWGFR